MSPVMVFMLLFNVSSLHLMFYVVGVLGHFCPQLSLDDFDWTTGVRVLRVVSLPVCRGWMRCSTSSTTGSLSPASQTPEGLSEEIDK